jgi:hypothetical protein
MKFRKGILLNYKPRNFFQFSFEIHFEPKEAPMEKLVPLIKTFKTAFYFKFFELRELLFGSVKV